MLARLSGGRAQWPSRRRRRRRQRAFTKPPRLRSQPQCSLGGMPDTRRARSVVLIDPTLAVEPAPGPCVRRSLPASGSAMPDATRLSCDVLRCRLGIKSRAPSRSSRSDMKSPLAKLLPVPALVVPSAGAGRVVSAASALTESSV